MAGIGTYIDLVNPYKFRETIEREANVDNPIGVFINAVIFGCLSVFLAFAMAYAQNAKTGLYSLPGASSFNTAGTPLGIIITFLLPIFSTYLISFILNGIAKLLGGDGTFYKVAWPQSAISVTYSLVAIPLTAIALIISIYAYCIIGIPLFIFALYLYYLYYKVIRAAHKSLSRNRAIITVVVGSILAAVIMMSIGLGRTIFRI